MFQIWIPNARAAEALDQVGLSDLTRPDEPGPAFTEFLDKGPDGGAGLLVEFFGISGKCSESTWQPCWGDKKRGLAPGRFWWGFPQGQKSPRLDPASLAFKKQVRSQAVRLADDQVWNLPNMVLLPHRLTLDPESGQAVRKIHPDWDKLYQRMCWAFEQCRAAVETDAQMFRDECCDYLVEVLQVNYRVNRELVYRLELFDDENWSSLVGVTVDRERLRAILDDVEKKRPVSTPPG